MIVQNNIMMEERCLIVIWVILVIEIGLNLLKI